MPVYLPRIMVLSFHCYQYQYYFEEEKTGDPMFCVTATMKYMFNAHAEVVNLHGDTFCLFVSAWNANMSNRTVLFGNDSSELA